MDITKYVLYYRNLQLYLSLGMKLKKIHRILEFNETPWMEPYIRMNTEFRKKSKSAFEKDFYKLKGYCTVFFTFYRNFPN